jgi:hypothetical protein
VHDPGTVADALHSAPDHDLAYRSAHLFPESEKIGAALLHGGIARDPTG